MRIEKSNKILAKFMGYNLKSYLTNEDYLYHKSWAWLMSVIEEIEKVKNIHVRIEYNICTIYNFKDVIISVHKDTKLKAVYEAVVKFIKKLKDENRK